LDFFVFTHIEQMVFNCVPLNDFAIRQTKKGRIIQYWFRSRRKC